MVHTCAVSLPYGLAHSHETIPTASHRCLNQLFPPLLPIISNNPLQEKNQLHPQFQKPWHITDDFADSKDALAGVDSITSDHYGNVLEANETPMNVSRANEKPINAFKENKTPTCVFKADVSSWSSIIFANLRTGQDRQAIDLYLKMRSVNVEPDGYVFVAVLKACSHLVNLEYGQQIHAHTIESGLELDAYVGDVLINMYAKCGNLEIAHVLFDRLPTQDMITWSVLIAADIQHGRDEEALSRFHCLAQTEVEMNSVLYILAVKACTNLTALEEGKRIHGAVVENGLESDLSLGNSLINMYARSRSLEAASTVLFRLPKRDVISWNSVIAGYTHSGYGYQAIQIFEMMLLDGLEPDRVSYITILKACSKATLSMGSLKKPCNFLN